MLPSKVMKIILFMPLFFILLCGCKNDKEKAICLVDRYMFENTNDYNSYEVIEFSEVDSGVIPYLYQDSVLDLFVRLRMNKLKSESYVKQFEAAQLLGSEVDMMKSKCIAEFYLDSVRAICEKYEHDKKEYISPNIGWQIEHKFRLKDDKGNYQIAEVAFFFNPTLDRIIKIVDLGEVGRILNSDD